MALIATRAMSFGVWVATQAAHGCLWHRWPCGAREADPERCDGAARGGLLRWTDLGFREGVCRDQRLTDGELRRLRRGVARRSLTRIRPARLVGWCAVRNDELRLVHIARTRAFSRQVLPFFLTLLGVCAYVRGVRKQVGPRAVDAAGGRGSRRC